MVSPSSSSRREDFLLGLERDVVEAFARDFRRDTVDSLSSSSRSRLLDLVETSEPALDRLELDLPKLNMMIARRDHGCIIFQQGLGGKSMCANFGVVVCTGASR